LARGYLNRAALTAERFVADPFSSNGNRLYRTGDRVRWNAEGQLDYLGRTDHQIKIRGFRVEPGEIEAQLLAQPNVREALVLALDAPGGARLVAYVVTQTEMDTTALRQQLAANLPDYLVPAAIVALPQFPLTPNGKVDRSALPAPKFGSEQNYQAPQGDVEQALAQLWAEVLGVEIVGRYDNFFELGGHSLLAIQLLDRVRGLGWSVEIRTLFRHSQLAEFAAQLVSGKAAQTNIIIPPNGIPANCAAIKPAMLPLIALTPEQIEIIETFTPGGAANIEDIYPLASLQQGILFHHQLQTTGDAYVTPCLLRFDSRERLERFVASLNRVIARHDILRTAVLWEGMPEPVQVVQRECGIDIEWMQSPDAERDVEAVLNQHVDPAHFRIDVRVAPMIRAIAIHDAASKRWLLQLPSHHLVLDHTTLDLLVQEISLIQQQREAELPAPVPFRNFVASARLGISDAEHEKFFRQLLGDVDEPTAPFGLMDIQGSGNDISEARLPLDAGLAQQIRQLARRHGVSTAAVFHLAWALVVARTSAKDDVVFGTVLFGRMQSGEDAGRAFGLFINTLPVRIHIGDMPLLHSLRQTHGLLTDLMHHEHANLSLAQRCSALPGGTPMFSSLFNYRHGATAKQVMDTEALWEGIDYVGGNERTNYPFDMSVDDLGDGFVLTAQVDDSIAASRVCEYLQRTLQQMMLSLETDASQSLRKLSLVGDAECQWLTQWGTNAARYKGTEPVHRLFERQVLAHPDAVAVIFNDEVLSYAQLNARINQLANALIKRGVRLETRIGIAVERSVEMIVAMMATLKVGGTYIPLDPDYPAERLAYMIESSDIKLLLTQTAVLQCSPYLANAGAVLLLDALDFAGESIADPEVEIHDTNLAYLIFTSGSTGKPKGVEIPHHALAEHVQTLRDSAEFVVADRVLQFSTFSFDAIVDQLFPPLITGATVVLRGNAVWDSETFYQQVLDNKISVVDVTPAYLQMLIQDFADRGLNDYGALRKIIVGGEALAPETFKLLRNAGLGHITLLNAYGPTEATVAATTMDCTPFVNGDRPAPLQVPIGRPLSGRHLYVLDDDANLAPIGVAGELYIGGALLARGYLNRQDLTVERFVADPFDEKGGRMYRTGDCVRWNMEGELVYLGRIDQQIKIRGFRIEPAEIETALLAQQGVRTAVVIAKQRPDGTRLVAYVAAAAEVDAAELKIQLALTLPGYMVPSVVMVLPHLPLSPTGKIDRAALPEPEWTLVRDHVVPRDDAERQMARIWEQVLAVHPVGRHDNFFELGGDSLKALRVVAQAKAENLKLDIDLRTFMRWPTIAQLLQREKTASADPVLRLNAPINDQAPLFCLHAGEGTIFGYKPLAQFLSGVCMVFGIACRMLLDENHVDHSLEQMARDYAAMIRRVQPQGPYRLLGWSLGGTLAALVASELEAQDCAVEVLALVDTYIPGLRSGKSVADDWRKDLREFIEPVLPNLDKVRLDRLLATAKIESETVVAQVMQELLDDSQNQQRLSNMATTIGLDTISAAELARGFVVARHLDRITGVASGLSSVRAAALTWWAKDRTTQERCDLAQQLGSSFALSRTLNKNHREIIEADSVWNDLKDRLTVEEDLSA